MSLLAQINEWDLEQTQNLPGWSGRSQKYIGWRNEGMIKTRKELNQTTSLFSISTGIALPKTPSPLAWTSRSLPLFSFICPSPPGVQREFLKFKFVYFTHPMTLRLQPQFLTRPRKPCRISLTSNNTHPPRMFQSFYRRGSGVTV